MMNGDLKLLIKINNINFLLGKNKSSLIFIIHVNSGYLF